MHSAVEFVTTGVATEIQLHIFDAIDRDELPRTLALMCVRPTEKSPIP